MERNHHSKNELKVNSKTMTFIIKTLDEKTNIIFFSSLLIFFYLYLFIWNYFNEIKNSNKLEIDTNNDKIK